MKSGTMSISMATVAKAAGVSAATVSRVLSGKPGVSAAKADEIRGIIKRLDYSMPVRPRGPKSRARDGIVHGNIAVLLIDRFAKMQTYPVFDAIFQGVESTLSELGLNLIFARVTQPDDLPDCVLKGNLDGLLLAGAEPDEALLARLSGFPSVSLSSRHTKSGDHVLPGREAVGQLAASYLLGRGHTHVAYLNVITENPAFRIQGTSFATAVQAAGARVDLFTEGGVSMRSEDLAIQLRESERAASPLVDSILAATPGPTGLFVSCDMLTAVLYRVLQKKGMHPWAGIDVVSCNNEQAFLAGLHPRPATIDIGAELVGRKAVDQLLWRMRHSKEASRVNVTIDPVLVPSPDGGGPVSSTASELSGS
jgi:DNA-binding LacI/PurR family transcriptional regulator